MAVDFRSESAIAVRFHHRLFAIQTFPDGSGRHARRLIF
ncbi:hypothetical protein SJ05684_b53020 (plasmid) [Sinorhizobium sojae CCBAU 05684]|uniref:Uncharacterized protein n=1 Tax=Sinorhizobium sojae CCBAU 05684 TaxID=716928 RepID=A0A249PKR8_9HYPH|nr:hypothetical protein SJ05684_b53020 [Sinorhizobium sojae CCBAU 05684]